MSRVESPTHSIDFWSLKSLLKSLEIILISMKSNDFEITYAFFCVGPLVRSEAEFMLYFVNHGALWVSVPRV